jgi:hypothetical protein
VLSVTIASIASQTSNGVFCGGRNINKFCPKGYANLAGLDMYITVYHWKNQALSIASKNQALLL